MSGWNMPPGVSVSDIPGNTVDDEEQRSGLDRRIVRTTSNYIPSGMTAQEAAPGYRRALIFEGEGYVFVERRALSGDIP